MTPRQARAARAMLNLNIKFVCEHAGVGKRTLTEFEAGSRAINSITESKIAAFYILEGIGFSHSDDKCESVSFRDEEKYISYPDTPFLDKIETFSFLRLSEIDSSLRDIEEIISLNSKCQNISRSLIIAWMRLASMNQKQLAQKLECSPAFISMIFIGKKQIPDHMADKIQPYFETIDVRSHLEYEKALIKYQSELSEIVKKSRNLVRKFNGSI
jgi:transcriptional regulator with XRE-family HTH domain